jgi:hypothetical protein
MPLYREQAFAMREVGRLDQMRAVNDPHRCLANPLTNPAGDCRMLFATFDENSFKAQRTNSKKEFLTFEFVEFRSM